MSNVVDSFDTDTFISEIENNPAIWNVHADEYSDKVAKTNAWMNVFRRIIPGFDDKTSAEKKLLSGFVQKKWKNLRDCYSREKQKQKNEHKSGGAANFRKRYIYFQQLNFLQATIKSSKTDDNADDDEEDQDKASQRGEEREQEEEEIDRPTRNSKRRKKTEQEDDEQKKCPKTQIVQRPNADASDEDTLFVLSLVPDIKKIPPPMKLDVKMKIMTVISQAIQASIQPPRLSKYPYQHPYFGGTQAQFARLGHGDYHSYHYGAQTSYGRPAQAGLLQETHPAAVQVNVPVTFVPMYPSAHAPSVPGEAQQAHDGLASSSASVHGAHGSPKSSTFSEFEFS